MIGKKKISKRDFLKYGFCGMCGAAIGFSPVSMLAGAKMKPPDHKFGGSKDLWKWSKEAYHYIKTPRGLRCLICPNECVVLPDEPGDCRTRVAFENKLYTIAYGNPCAVHVDPIEKKPLYHFLPSTKAFSIATAGCNLACLNCQNWNISQASPEDTTNYDLMPEQVVEECLNYKCRSIAYTYSDPIAFYEYTYDTAKLARARGIKNVIITAGYINEKPLRQFCEVVDAANVDLKSFSDEIYMMLNAGKLKPVLDTIKILKQEGVWLEITNLIVPSWTDDFDMIKKMCDWLYDNDLYDCPLHFSRFHPQYKLTNLPATPESTLKQAREIALNAGIRFVYIGNVPGSDAENTYCPNCEKLLIERKGFFVSQNHVKDSKCEFCDESIPGVWE
jgi:pyruvate formate lyase activating enzyme